jgi:phytoene dehydrogenase-like protein
VGQEKVSPKASKKQILLDFFQARERKRLEVGDLRAAQDELRCHLGPSDRTSLGYIASVLREAGYEVQYEDRYSDSVIPEPYATRLKGVLEFHDLASAEQSLLRLDAIFREYSGAADQAGIKYVRALVKKGKLRARSLAANPRVNAPKRQEKQEIARWFQVWLETPDLFVDWLALRKSSDEFRSLFGGADAGEM